MNTDKPPDKTSVIVVTTLVTFMVSFTGASINIALPKMGAELAMDAISLGWVATAFFLATIVLNVPFARIADIHGRKKIFNLGIIVFTGASFFLVLANSDIMLIGLRFVQGVGGAMIISPCVAILTSVFPTGDRGRVLGLNSATVYVGHSLGPFLGGLLTQYLGWRSIFMVMVPVGLIATTIVFWRLKGDWVEAKGERFDVVGSILYTLMLIAITYGFTHLPDLFGVWLILIGIIGLVAFIVWETKAQSPIFDINLFRKNRAFVLSSLATLVNYGAAAAVGFLLSLYLQYIKGFSPQEAGLVLVSQPVIQVIFSPLAGRISDRVPPRIVASAGMSCTVVGLLLFILLNEETAMLQIVVALVLIGLGLAFFVSPNTNAIMSSVDKKFYGLASATVATMRQLGVILSMGIVMLLFALYMGRVQITPESYGAFLQSIRTAFIISAIFCFLGIVASLAGNKTDGSNHQNS